MDWTIIKINHKQEEVWQYTGRLVRKTQDFVMIEARFNRPDLFIHGMWLNQGDRFIELYYLHRWFNVFEIHDHLDDRLKGWYCNLTRPAHLLGGNILEYVDLALDLLVFPDGTHLLLDEDEFENMNPDSSTRSQVDAATRYLQKWFAPPITLRLETCCLT